jgi:hypothetical protein
MAATNAGNGVPSGETMMRTFLLIALLFSTIARAQRSAWQNCITVNNMPCTKLHLHWPLPEPIPSTPPVGHIQCWEAEHPDSRHLMCGDSWGSLVDVTEALEKKHQELCKAMPTTEEREKCEHL